MATWRRCLFLFLLLFTSCTSTAPETPATNWFPANYDSSRARFRDACARLKGLCASWPIPSRTDPGLTIDHGFFSRGGDRLLVIQSGIHGTEAASGAAVQAFVMDTYLEPLLSQGIDVLFIHALNPWGFKHGRRNDEFNINLNRNFSVDGSDYRFDNQDYRRFRRVFEPGGGVGSTWWGSLRGSLGFVNGVIGAGFDTAPLNNGLDNGQYEFPLGINYGGKAPQPQTAFLKQKIAPILARNYKKTLYLDFHTGLGDKDGLAVILGKNPEPAQEQALRSMLGQYRDQGIKITSPSDPKFFATVGDVIDFVPSLSRHPHSFLAVTMEYGTIGDDTVSQLRSANRIILDNQKYNFGCISQRICNKVDQHTRDMFNPRDKAWRQAVIHKADLVFRALVEKFR